jgi:hypothetical protein
MRSYLGASLLTLKPTGGFGACDDPEAKNR